MTAVTRSRTRPFHRMREFGSSVTTIMVKELRSRFRGRLAFVILTVYVALLALIAYGIYSIVAPEARTTAQFGGGPFGTTFANASATIGQAIFALLSMFQLLLICFIAPAFTAGAISLEREKQTLDLLVTTPMRPGGIVVGKLLSALAFVGLMILAALPISALVLMYGGVSVDDLVRQQVVLLVTALGLGAIGLFWSALVKRTQAATVLTYASVLALTLGTMLIFIFWSEVATRSSENEFAEPHLAPEQLLWVNPAIAMIEVVANTEITYGDFSKIMQRVHGGVTSTQVCEGDVCFNSEVVGPDGIKPMPVEAVGPRGGVFMDGGAAFGVAVDLCPRDKLCLEPGGGDAAVFDPQPLTGHFWPRFAFTFAGLSVLLTLASMRLVVPAGMRFAFVRRRPAATVEPNLPPETDL